MVRIDLPESLNSYLLKISFRRWAKLWAMTSLNAQPLSDADSAESRDHAIGGSIRAVPIRSLRTFTSLKRYSMKKRAAVRARRDSARPNSFLLECYNPNSAAVSMTLTIRREESPLAFQAALPLEPGFNEHRVAVEEISRLVDLSGPFHIELTPNDTPEGLTLYFGAMDFVADEITPAPTTAPARANGRICKCVVWDLDNTIWDGTLIEDGLDRLRLKPRIIDTLKSLDERGILLAIASKNNKDDGLAALRHFGIDQYFLCPEISWEPKSEAVRRIAASLNIGLDSITFVDDSAFEREEIAASCPEVATIDAVHYLTIPERPECQQPVTEESRKRRLLYRDQYERDAAQREFNSDYFAFLRGCGLKLLIRPMSTQNLERVHELTQRTNQMNFSGNRYSRDQLVELLRSDDADHYVLDCSDRFGNYGTIGFCIVHRVDARMTDLMFSCRIQGKRVEHAFVSHLVRAYRRAGRPAFQASYRKTKKNTPAGKVFDDLGFQSRGEIEGVTQLVLPAGVDLTEEGIVTIEDRDVPSLTSQV